MNKKIAFSSKHTFSEKPHKLVKKVTLVKKFFTPRSTENKQKNKDMIITPHDMIDRPMFGRGINALYEDMIKHEKIKASMEHPESTNEVSANETDKDKSSRRNSYSIESVESSFSSGI